MKIKPKGRKIYRHRTRFERLKRFLRSRSAVFATIFAVLFIGFVGFSAGGPVLRFLEEQEIITKKTESDAESSETEPPESLPEEQPAASQTEPPTEAAAEKPLSDMHVYVLETDALSEISKLQTALGALPADATHAAVQLKSEGGMLHYATALPDAKQSGAVVSVIPLSTICDTIEDAGLIPVAVINAFEDSVYPRAFAESGYQIAGTGERWLDNTVENDGKPWLSPFSDLAVDYLSTLTAEIAGADFPVILCEGFSFPDFSEEDLRLVDPRAGSAERERFLAEASNAMQGSAGDALFLLKADGAALLAGETQFLQSVTADAIALTVEDAAQKEEAFALLADRICIPVAEEADAALAENGCYIIFPDAEEAESTAISDNVE